MPVDRATTPLPPGSTIGIFGSGQLGRMSAQAAQRLGYQVHIFSPDRNTPAGQVTNRETTARFDDLDAIDEFARSVDVVTLEFENVPIQAVERAAKLVPTRPGASVLHTVQHRLREKTFLEDHGIACSPFRSVASLPELDAAIRELGCPAILKTAADGYDGKGQQRIDAPGQTAAAWQAISQREAVLEGFVDFEHELSVIVARSPSGELATYGPIANAHANHILDVSVLPHPALDGVAFQACDVARLIAEKLDVVGIICVEFFLTGRGELLVNEIAPRPHNSGHLTIEACVTSQFEQHVRAVCGLPLGSAELFRPAAMANLLGHLWEDGEPYWSRALASDTVKLHLYGKSDPRPGRKMGHLTALAESPAEAERLVRAARDALTR
jgi:5-(carboxyamino)imidazole ribonucleotide synthase